PAQRTVRTKTLKAIPTTYFDAHQKLRDTNKTNLDFSNYIMEALREKLEREGGI
ncbi:chaperonin, partial [Klebsiella variicola]